LNTFLELVNKFFQRYSVGQRIVLVIVFIGIISSIISLLVWSNRPEYDILFSDLDPTNANQILTELRGMNVNYRLDNNGKTIYVPINEAPELRLKFANSGYVGSNVKGYEIFDDSKIGMTTFMQELNVQRALEGELTKTINQFDEVRNSRVHLVLPKNKLFEKEQKGTASVVLYLVPGKRLEESQIHGIAALVSNSVKGIKQNDVVIVDSEGNLLSSGEDSENALGPVGNQWDLRSREEKKLQQKVEDIVGSIVGPNNAVVKVSVDLNFERLERTREIPDMDNIAVVSEESHSETITGSDTVNNTQNQRQNKNIITNYEIGKTREHYIGNTGTIDKISVAVLVNGKYTDSGNGKDGSKTYIPRTSKELNQIAALVKSSIGYDENRGDVVEVQNIELSGNQFAEDKEYFEKAERREFIQNLITKGLIVLGAVLAIYFLQRLLKSLGNNVPLVLAGQTPVAVTGGSNTNRAVLDIPEEEDIPEDLYIKKLSPEAKAKLKAKDKMTTDVVNYVKESPEDAAKLIRSWITNIHTNQ